MDEKFKYFFLRIFIIGVVLFAILYLISPEKVPFAIESGNYADFKEKGWLITPLLFMLLVYCIRSLDPKPKFFKDAAKKLGLLSVHDSDYQKSYLALLLSLSALSVLVYGMFFLFLSGVNATYSFAFGVVLLVLCFLLFRYFNGKLAN